MPYWFLFLLASVLTFFYGILLSFILGIKEAPVVIKGYHFHHSIFGIPPLLWGTFSLDVSIIIVGVGIIFAHGLEEIIFCKKRFPLAFFHFITRDQNP